MQRLARFAYRRRWLVLGAWLLAAVGAFVLPGRATAYNDSLALPRSESTRAIRLLQASGLDQSLGIELIVLSTSGGAKITDPAVRLRAETMLADVAKLQYVTAVRSPYDPGAARQISSDGTTAFASVVYAQHTQISLSEAKAEVGTAKAAREQGLDVAVAGPIAKAANPSPFSQWPLAIFAAALVLYAVFRTFLAMLVPLATALISLVPAIGGIGLLSNLISMPDSSYSSELALLIGLCVGVDYALRVMVRHRESLLGGAETEKSVVQAATTCGRVVVLAAVLLCVALLGVFALGVGFLDGLAVAAGVAALFALLGSLTLLPALLGFLGTKVLPADQRAEIGKVAPPKPAVGWARWARVLQRRPAVWVVLGLLVAAAVALPLFSLRLGFTDSGSDQPGTTTREAYDLLAKGFGPGFNGPLWVTARGQGGLLTGTLDRLREGLAATPGMMSVWPPQVVKSSGGFTVALMIAFPSSGPQDAATTDLISRLRSRVIPQAVAGSGVKVYVGGLPAVVDDFTASLRVRLPLFIGVMMGLLFIVLTIAFRSIVIAVIAGVGGLASACAAVGALVAVFQWGWLDSVFGVSQTGPVEAFLPALLFAILFGLAPACGAFLLTRIQEEHLTTGSTADAVGRCLAADGQTNLAAAMVMLLIAGSFIGQENMLGFGLGLLVAILVDAVVVRSVLVPSLMLALGKATWWFPHRLRRLPPALVPFL